MLLKGACRALGSAQYRFAEERCGLWLAFDDLTLESRLRALFPLFDFTGANEGLSEAELAVRSSHSLSETVTSVINLLPELGKPND